MECLYSKQELEQWMQFWGWFTCDINRARFSLPYLDLVLEMERERKPFRFHLPKFKNMFWLAFKQHGWLFQLYSACPQSRLVLEVVVNWSRLEQFLSCCEIFKEWQQHKKSSQKIGEM